MRVAPIVSASAIVLLLGCSRGPTPLSVGMEQRLTNLESHVYQMSDRFYQPPLRNLMSDMQRDHDDLWFALQDENWPLAQFKVAGLEEQMAAVVRYHPSVPEVPRPMMDALASTLKPALQGMRSAVQNQDKLAARTAYTNLTGACNQCHDSSGTSFIRVAEPVRERR